MVSELNLPNISTPVPNLAILTGKVVAIQFIGDLLWNIAVALDGVANYAVLKGVHRA